MKDGKILKWNFKVGDKVIAGDVIAEIQTDKSTVGFEIQDDGFIAQLLAQEGNSDVEVGQPIVVIARKKDNVAAFQNYTPDSESKEDAKEEEQEEEGEAPAKPSTGKQSRENREEKEHSGQSNRQQQDNEEQEEEGSRQRDTQQASRQRNDGERVFITPYARKIAKEKGIDFNNIQGTGPFGRIKSDDIMNAKPQQAQTRSDRPDQQKPSSDRQGQTAGRQAAGTPAGKFQDMPLSQMRKVIATRLQESKQQIPHYYVTMEIKMDKLLSLRKTVNEDMKEKISVNDFIIKAASLACKAVPEANSQWLGDKIRR